MGNSKDRSWPQRTQTRKQWGDASDASTVMLVTPRAAPSQSPSALLRKFGWAPLALDGVPLPRAGTCWGGPCSRNDESAVEAPEDGLLVD